MNYPFKENTEHVILHCRSYEVESQVFQDRVQEAGRESDGDTGIRRRGRREKEHQEGIISIP